MVKTKGLKPSHKNSQQKKHTKNKIMQQNMQEELFIYELAHIIFDDIMGRKRSLWTSDERYATNMTQFLSAKTGDPKQAKRIAEQAKTRWLMGFARYNSEWNIIKQQLKIPPAISGVYRAFFNELVKKVRLRRVMTVELLIEKWKRMMGDYFDVDLAYEIARRAGVPVEQRENKNP
ncbi:MAG: hypothetical protein ACP5IZ_01805 [Thermoprotei archaeon]|jgi:hypothetical protein